MEILNISMEMLQNCHGMLKYFMEMLKIVMGYSKKIMKMLKFYITLTPQITCYIISTDLLSGALEEGLG